VVAGRCSPNEEPLDTVRREIREETNLRVEVEESPVDSYAMEYEGHSMLVIIYRATAFSEEVRLSDEHDAFEWCLVEDFARRTAFPRLAEAVRRALRAG